MTVDVTTSSSGQELSNLLTEFTRTLTAVLDVLTQSESSLQPGPQAARFRELLTETRGDLEPHEVDLFLDVIADFVIRSTERADADADATTWRPDFPYLLDRVIRYFPDSFWLLTFAERLHKVLEHDDRLPILNRSLITFIYSAFETLVAGLMKLHYSNHPGSLGGNDSDARLTFEDLRGDSSAAELLELAVDRRLEDQRGGFNDWAKWLDTTFGIKLAEIARDWPFLCRAVEVRHIIVHNSSHISHAFLRNVRKSGVAADDDAVGKRFIADAEYVRRYLDEFFILGVVVTLLVWGKIVPVDRPRILSVLSNSAYASLATERYQPARHLTYVGTLWRKPDDDPTIALIIQVNHWIACKHIDPEGPWKDEVREWDVASLATNFKLAKSCLLDNTEEALRHLTNAFSAQEISKAEIMTWPLLLELRATPEFEAFMNTIAVSPPAGNTSSPVPNLDVATLDQIAEAVRQPKERLISWLTVRFPDSYDSKDPENVAQPLREAIARYFSKLEEQSQSPHEQSTDR